MAFLGIAPELAYDSCGRPTFRFSAGHVRLRGSGLLRHGLDMCSDEVTPRRPGGDQCGPHSRPGREQPTLIGQITTCESFNFRVCVAFQSGVDVFTQCTDGFVEVTDLCVPMIDPQFSVVEEIDCFGETASVEILPNDPTQPFNSTVEYTLWELTEPTPFSPDNRLGSALHGHHRRQLLRLARRHRPHRGVVFQHVPRHDRRFCLHLS